MAEIVNLRHVRKGKARQDAARVAEANRAWFGLSAAERQRLTQEKERQRREIDGHKREGGAAPPPPPGEQGSPGPRLQGSQGTPRDVR